MIPLPGICPQPGASVIDPLIADVVAPEASNPTVSGQVGVAQIICCRRLVPHWMTGHIPFRHTSLGSHFISCHFVAPKIVMVCNLQPQVQPDRGMAQRSLWPANTNWHWGTLARISDPSSLRWRVTCAGCFVHKGLESLRQERFLAYASQ